MLNHICSCPTAAPLGTLLQSMPVYSIFLVPGGGLLPFLVSGRARNAGSFRGRSPHAASASLQTAEGCEWVPMGAGLRRSWKVQVL